MHMAIKNGLLVGAGGFAGSILRYMIAVLLQKSSLSLPFGTLIANVLGCFVIGIVCHSVPLGRMLPENMKLLIAIGFCGGLTTASSFVQQTVTLHRTGEYTQAAAYLALTLLASFVAFYAGIYASQLIVKH